MKERSLRARLAGIVRRVSGHHIASTATAGGFRMRIAARLIRRAYRLQGVAGHLEESLTASAALGRQDRVLAHYRDPSNEAALREGAPRRKLSADL